MRYDKLLSELKFVEDDLKYHKTAVEKAKQSFSENFNKKVKNLGLPKRPPRPSPKKKQKPRKRKRAKTKETRDLFKKIATVTHPDKILELPIAEKKEKEKKFIEANEAAEEGRALSLHKIAKDVGVEIPEISEIQLALFEEEIAAHKEELENLKKTWLWIWRSAQTEEERESIMSKYVDFLLTRGLI